MPQQQQQQQPRKAAAPLPYLRPDLLAALPPAHRLQSTNLRWAAAAGGARSPPPIPSLKRPAACSTCAWQLVAMRRPCSCTVILLASRCLPKPASGVEGCAGTQRSAFSRFAWWPLIQAIPPPGLRASARASVCLGPSAPCPSARRTLLLCASACLRRPGCPRPGTSSGALQLM